MEQKLWKQFVNFRVLYSYNFSLIISSEGEAPGLGLLLPSLGPGQGKERPSPVWVPKTSVRYQTIWQLLSRELFGAVVISSQSPNAIYNRGTMLEVSMAVGPLNTHSFTWPDSLCPVSFGRNMFVNQLLRLVLSLGEAQCLYLLF